MDKDWKSYYEQEETLSNYTHKEHSKTLKKLILLNRFSITDGLTMLKTTETYIAKNR